MSELGIPSSQKMSRLRVAKWSVLGRDRSYTHKRRKFYHFLMGMVCFGLYGFILDRTGALVALGTVGGTFILLDIARLRIPALNGFFLKWVGGLMRREEINTLSANSYFVLGLIVVTLLFPKEVVLFAVLALAIGDPVAAVVGTQWGRNTLIKGRSLEGFLANFMFTGVAGVITGALYFGYGSERSVILGGVFGLCSALGELIHIPPINDNLTVPIFAAVLMSLAATFVPLF